MPKCYRQLWVKDLPKVPTWRLECEPATFRAQGTKPTTEPPRPIFILIVKKVIAEVFKLSPSPSTTVVDFYGSGTSLCNHWPFALEPTPSFYTIHFINWWAKVPLFVLSRLLSSPWVSCTVSASDWCALQEALYTCIDIIQNNTMAMASVSECRFCEPQF